jgi:hypothetical protein
MTAPKRNENRSVPDGVQTVMQPYKAMQRDATPHFLHSHSRKNASSAGMSPAFSRRSPSVSQVSPAVPRRFPSVGQAHMLQPLLGPCHRVRIHPVMWMSREAARQENQR